jgi:hypothetical protein
MEPKIILQVELKRIDNLWHFFATQNNLFLKKKVDKEICYKLVKGQIELIHVFLPNFLEQSSLTIRSKGFGRPIAHYTSQKKRFGVKEPFYKPNEKIFFPKELLMLSTKHSVYVEKDPTGLWKVVLMPFQPKNIGDILKPVNLITHILWNTAYFSETIKN